MFEIERRLYADLCLYTRQLVADLSDEELAEQPAPGLNHPAWTLGHLVVGADYLLYLIGKPTTAPEGWGGIFNPGTVPDPNRSAYPSKSELLSAYEAAHAAVDAALAEVTSEQLAAPNPMDSMRARFPTLGDLLGYLSTTHEATHLGQLSAWRRMMGKGSVAG